jgi:hypothetical protein
MLILYVGCIRDSNRAAKPMSYIWTGKSNFDYRINATLDHSDRKFTLTLYLVPHLSAKKLDPSSSLTATSNV